jgi:hypothetical protein
MTRSLEKGPYVDVKLAKKVANRKPTEAGKTILGRIRIDGHTLVAEVNSNKRAATLKKKIETALGSDVKYVTKSIQTIEGNLGKEPPAGSSPSQGPVPLDKLPPEALDAARKMAAAHWDKWFDVPVPALNGMTPRDAARTKDGRDLLESLFSSYERSSAVGLASLLKPDLEKMRVKLKLPKRS